MNKPITVERADFINAICKTINASPLPAFVKVEVLERVLDQLRPQIDAQYQQDAAFYKQQVEQEKQEAPEGPTAEEGG